MFRWDFAKNRILLQTRGITFEEVIEAICEGYVVSDTSHPNAYKYPNQRLLVVHVKEYTFAVPYVIDGNDIFLKTIIPSRKAHKKYRKGE